jgi:hypothetical protein
VASNNGGDVKIKVRLKPRDPNALKIVGRNRVHKDRKRSMYTQRLTNADIWRRINVGV